MWIRWALQLVHQEKSAAQRDGPMKMLHENILILVKKQLHHFINTDQHNIRQSVALCFLSCLL